MKQNTFMAMSTGNFEPCNPWSVTVGHCATHGVDFDLANGCGPCAVTAMDLAEFTKLCAAADYDSDEVTKGDK